MRSVIFGILPFTIAGIALSLLFQNFDFAIGVALGTAGSIFWMVSLDLDVKKAMRSGNINKVKLGYLMRLMISAGVLGIGYGISTRAFFGSCLGLLFLKLGVYMSFLFPSGRGNNRDEAEFIKKG